MGFVRGNLSEEQKARIEANRKKALERLHKKTGSSQVANNSTGTTATSGSNNNLRGPSVIPATTGNSSTTIRTTTAPSANSTPSSSTATISSAGPVLKRPRIELTPEQKKRIEENRQKAMEIQKQKQQNSRDGIAATKESIGPIPLYSHVRLQKNPEENGQQVRQPLKAHVHKKDYIEYDFSTMKDSRGGFIGVDDIQAGSGSATGAVSLEAKTLEEWKERQKRQEIVREAPPPLDLANAPKCFECNSVEIDHKFFDNFNKVRVCRSCTRANPDKYALLTKTECREDYLLTDPELRDTSLLARIEKPNPHGFSRMQLFLRFQVEEFAWKKWGSPEKLDEEWEKRETVRLQRKEKKYTDKLKEMRKKTRAEEYTRKLRNGESLGQRHVHDWSEPIVHGENYKRRCIDCGLETEELIM